MALSMLAGQTAGAAMGIGSKIVEQKMNRKQAAYLQGLNIEGQKEMTDYQYGKMMDMWKNTNYKAQVAEMKKAGINPALLYGMGGGGGTTAGGGSASVTTQSGGSEGNIMAAMDIATQKAQVDLMQAQADNLKADSENKRGVDRAKTDAETQNLLQGYDNLRNSYDLQMLEKSLKNLELHQKEGTVEDAIKQVQIETKNALRRLQIVSNDAKESDETLAAKITTVKNMAIGSGLDNILRKVGAQKGEEEIKKIRNDIQMMVERNMREWDSMSRENQRVAIQKELAAWETDLSRWGTEQMVNLLDNIMIITPKINTEQKRNPIGFGK